MSQLTFSSLQQLLQSQTQHHLTDIGATHPFSFSQNHQIPPNDLPFASQKVGATRLENARNYFQIRRNDLRPPNTPFLVRDENLVNHMNSGGRKLARITGARKFLIGQSRIGLENSQSTVISEPKITSQANLSRSPVKRSDNQSQLSRGSSRTSEAKEKNHQSPFYKNSSAVKNFKPDVSTATRQLRPPNRQQQKADPRSFDEGRRLFRPRIDLQVRQIESLNAEKVDRTKENSDDDKPSHLLSRKNKMGAEDFPCYIEFQNQRKKFAFKMFEVEKRYIRFVQCACKLQAAPGDNDVDTDEEEVSRGLERNFKAFRASLFECQEEERLYRLSAPRNKSIGPIVVGTQQSKRTPSFVPATKNQTHHLDVDGVSPLQDPRAQANKNRSIFKANAYRG